MKIIPYNPIFKEQVQKVCISQSTSRFKDEKAQKATLALYCDEYLDHEIAFLLLNDDEKVAGYILCAPDLKQYDQNMKEYVEILKETDPEKYQRYFDTLHLHAMFYQEYPAHLHIDLLEEYTGGGNGSKLMKTLLSYLKEQNVPGIMVTVDTNNIRACKFYEKMGFKPFEDKNFIVLQKL